MLDSMISWREKIILFSRACFVIRINDLYWRHTVKVRWNPGVWGARTPDSASCSEMLINACQHGGLFIGFVILTISILNSRKIHVQTHSPIHLLAFLHIRAGNKGMPSARHQ